MISALWLAVLLAAPAEAHPNFSGSWELDLERSKLEVPAPVATTLTIRHKDDDFHLLATHVYQDRSRTVTFHLPIDGQEHLIEEDGVTQHITLSWSGPTLLLQAYWMEGGVKSTNTARYTVSRDGKSLGVRETEHIRGREFRNTWVFRRR
jgi:hypothetical protein